MTRLALAILAALAVAASCAILTPGARADDSGVAARRAWIHAHQSGCCPHDNCFRAEPELAREGWEVPGLAGSVRPRDVKPWPFRDSYACHYRFDETRTIKCLFMRFPEGS